MNLRVAVNGTRKSGDTYVDKPNFFDVEVYGNHGNIFTALMQRGVDLKGHRVLINGQLDYQEWQTDGQTRSKVVINVAGGGQIVYEGEPRNRQAQPSTAPAGQPAASPAGFVPRAPTSGPPTAVPQPYGVAAAEPASAAMDHIPF